MARSRKRALVALVVVAPMLVACNAILGISDYSKQECNGGGTACETVLPDAQADSTPTDASKDNNVVLIDARGADPVAWAHFKMPNYTQDPDGGPDANPAKWVLADDHGTAVVDDKVTLLTWRVVLPGEQAVKPWSSAATFCSDLNAGWRLPTRIELVSILDLAQSGRADKAFGLQANPYWTTSLDRHRIGATVQVTALHWVVNFNDQGSPSPVFTQAEEKTAGVICVKGKQ